MNLTFTDISSVYTNMVQQDFPKDSMLENTTADPGKQGLENPRQGTPLFAQKLSKTLEKEQAAAGGKIISGPQDAEKVVGFLSEKMGNESGAGFVSTLKNTLLMLSKGNLKNISLDSEGLAALKKMLIQAGFKESDLDELMGELTQNDKDGKMPLDEFLDALFELPAGENFEIETSQEVFLETSAVPILESLLISLGIPSEKIQEILASADNGSYGISLDEIIENLRSVQKTSFYNHTHYQTQGDNENLLHVLKQLGLGGGEKNSSNFSLDDMVASLESLRTKMSQEQSKASFIDNSELKSVSGEKPLDLLNTLFKGLNIENASTEKAAFGFSADQIKDQFKNSLGDLDEAGLSSNAKNGANSSLKEVFKGMAALMDEKKSALPGETNFLEKDARNALKQLKHGDAKGTDHSQISASDLKSTDAASNLNNLKTNASLKNLPTYVTHQVTRSLVRAINQGENTLRIQLNPPELGRLTMTIDNTGNTLRVSIVTESLAAKDILTSNATELKSVLSNSGVNLERFDVDMNSDFRQSMADARNQAGNFSRRRQNKEKELSGENNNEETNAVGNLTDALNQESSLHYVA